MLYAYTYVNALLSLLITFGLARHLEQSTFQAIALGLTAGGFGAVLSNMGTDQSQLGSLLRTSSTEERMQVARRNLAHRHLIYLLLLGLLSAYTIRSNHNWQQTTGSIIFFAWAAMLGLQPNAYADYLHIQARQQLVIALERTGVVSGILLTWVLIGTHDIFIGIFVGIILLAGRTISTAYQWHTVLQEDRRRSTDTQPRLQNNEKSGVPATSITPTLAALFNSCTAYLPVIFLDHFNKKQDLALYSLILQAANIVILFQGMASRVLSVRIAITPSPAAAPHADPPIIHLGLQVLLASTGLAILGGTLTATYLIRAHPEHSTTESLSLVIILFTWGAWLGFGQVITRALVLHEQADYYAWATGVTALISATSAWLFIPHHGAVASALSIAIPHSIMIAMCARHLRRTLSRTHSK